MRIFSKILAAAVVAASVSAAAAAEGLPPRHHGMGRDEAFRFCQDQHFHRPIQMRQCVIEKMRGE